MVGKKVCMNILLTHLKTKGYRLIVVWYDWSRSTIFANFWPIVWHRYRDRERYYSNQSFLNIIKINVLDTNGSFYFYSFRLVLKVLFLFVIFCYGIEILLPFSPLKPRLRREISEGWNRNNYLHGSFEVAIGW